MDARRSRRRRRRRRLTKEEEEDTAAKESPSSPLLGFSSSSSSSSSPLLGSSSSSSSSSSRTAQRKIPLSVGQQQPDPDARGRRPLLLSQIRSYYLEAISRLPAAELRTTLAPGLLIGGHCYGPLHPVHNIMVNAVWYAAAFPFRGSDPIDVDVITSQGIMRLAHRSLDGLVASLRHHCPALSRDDALWHLCLSGADIHGAATSARGRGRGRARSKLEPEVAARAARHPKPAAFALFATTVLPLPAVERAVLSLLAGRRSLSSTDILRLSAMLLPFPMPDVPPPQQPSPSERTQRAVQFVDEKRRNYKRLYQALLGVADAALRKFAHQTGAHYQLHTIYGRSIVSKGCCTCASQYYHINFMAWPVQNRSSCQAPVRFFAEAHDPHIPDCREEEITLCCALQAQPSPAYVDSCYKCALTNQIVDHPDTEKHFGRHPYKTIGTKNDRDCPSTVDVDYRFFDPDRDIEFLENHAPKIGMIEAICPKFPSKPKVVALPERFRSHFWAPNSSGDEDDSDDSD